MVAERSITVKLKLDKSDFSRGLADAAREAKAFQKAMSGGSGSGGRTIFSSLGDDADDFSTSIDTATGSTRAFRRELASGGKDGNTFGKGISASNSHLALMVQYGVALGPALVPALAAAVPLAAALGSGLAFATVGAGTAVLAFQGVGDALKAMNDYAIDPTAEHLQKLQETMDTLGPAGQNFVLFLQELRPEMQKLQNIAQEGMFPGLQEGIESVMTQMPLVQQVIESVSTTMGELAASGGEALTSPFWIDFFEYIRDDATDIITNFSVGFGKLFEGVSALLLDFAPLTDTIAAGFADIGRSFSSWAQGLPETEGFQEFIRYLRDTGPQVLDTIANLAGAMLDLGVALSGLPAQEALLILNTLANVISAIASSPIGPGLLSVAVGLAAITRAIAVWDTVQASAVMQFLGTGKGAHVAGGGSILSRAGSLATVSNLTKVAGAVGLVALSMTDLDEKAGLSGTLSGAAIGLIFSPWAAAAGAVAGATLDAAAANDELTKSLDASQDAIEHQDFSAQGAALVKSAEQLDKFRDATDHSLSSANDYLARAKNLTEDVFGKSDVEEATDRQEELNEKFQDGARGVSELSRELGNADAPTGNYKDHLEELTTIATDLAPALDHLGVSMADIRHLGSAIDSDNPILAAAGQIGVDALAGDIERYELRMASLPARTNAVGDAIAQLGDDSIAAASKIDDLQSSLDALLDPALDAEEAMDALSDRVQAFTAETVAGAGFTGFTAGAKQNREFTRGYIEDLKQVIVTQAQNGASSRELANLLVNERQRFIESGIAAGFSAREMVARAQAIGLTPRLIVTAFKQPGMKEAQVEALRLKIVYESLPKEVRTQLEADGISANATVASLMRKYEGLSRYEAVTILRARDEASGVVANVLGLLNQIPLFKTTTIRSNTINTVLDRHLTQNRASGGLVTGPGGPRDDKIPAMISNGEFVVNAAATKQNLDLLFRLNAQKFADGGQAGREISAGQIGRRSVREDLSFMRDLERALNRLRHEAREVEHAEDRVKASRERSREAAHRLEIAEKSEKTSKERLHALTVASTKATKHQAYEEKQLAKQEAELAKARDKWQQQQQQLLSQAQAISSVIREQGAIFGGQGTSTTVSGILAKLRSSAKDGIQFRGYIAKLRGMGLDERLIQQLLEQGPTPEGLATARNLAHASEAQIRQITRQEQRLVGVAASTGALAIRHGNTVIVNMNIKKVETTDVKALERNLPRRVSRALRVARQVS